MERIEEESVLMTQEIWEHYLRVCVQDRNVWLFNKLWNAYPNFAVCMLQEFDHIVSQSDNYVSKEETLASWERMKARLREEYGKDFI